jgi:DHA3 family macrolide efflux protein-like MFS transporter
MAIVPLFFIPIPQPESSARERGGHPSVLEEMREGFRYVLAWPGLLLVLIMAMLINFVANPAGSLLPLFVTKHLHGDALGLGWLNSSLGVGVVLGGLALGVWGGFRRRIVTTLLGVVGMGLGFLVVGLTPQGGLWIAAGGLFFAGTMNAMANGPLSALLQSQVAPGMQGRVFTLVQSLVTAMSPLSLALAGPLADLFGIRFLYVVSAAVMVLLGAGALFVRPILHLEDVRAARSTPAEEAAASSTRRSD